MMGLQLSEFPKLLYIFEYAGKNVIMCNYFYDVFRKFPKK